MYASFSTDSNGNAAVNLADGRRIDFSTGTGAPFAGYSPGRMIALHLAPAFRALRHAGNGSRRGVPMPHDAPVYHDADADLSDETIARLLAASERLARYWQLGRNFGRIHPEFDGGRDVIALAEGTVEPESLPYWPAA